MNDMNIFVNVPCKFDGAIMQFIPVKVQGLDNEGLLVCPKCKDAILVTEGIIDALPSDLKSERNRALLASRISELVLN
jgi:hypothetical protein